MAAPATALSRKSGRIESATGETTTTFAAEWPIYVIVAASTCIAAGLLWDISWHRTIGRDTFWSPPHLIEQIAAVVAGLSCAYIALRTSFGNDSVGASRSVRFWKFFRAPLGVWVCIWGTIMMVTSAPFDNWWHNAYGLDVKIISPPHIILALGMYGIQLGAMLLALSAQNRAATERDRRRLGMIFAYSAGVVIVMVTVFLMEDAAFANEMHGSLFYKVTAGSLPLFLVAFARASRLSWPATRIAACYMAIMLVTIWTLQLFPAQPLLAPIYNAVTSMVPHPFPLLLIVPAVGIDLLMRRVGDGRDWVLSAALGFAFVAMMVAVHWFWAEFMMSPAARNFVFGADQWDYTERLGPWRYEYW
ncbi:MAG: hypothetical protein ABIR58_08150, partial [Gemmatimonadaceae bacterium]